MIGKTSKQQSLFLPSLKVMLNPKHELFQLSKEIDWSYLKKEFEKYLSIAPFRRKTSHIQQISNSMSKYL